MISKFLAPFLDYLKSSPLTNSIAVGVLVFGSSYFLGTDFGTIEQLAEPIIAWLIGSMLNAKTKRYMNGGAVAVKSSIPQDHKDILEKYIDAND